MSDAELHGALRPAARRQRLSDPADHAGHEEAGPLPQRRLVGLSRLDPARRARRPPSTSSRSGGRWPDAGVGIVCGPVVAVDIDITDPELALELERLCRARLGDTPALRIGRAPKRLLVYRAAAPFAGIRRAPLEVLGLGQQFVAHAIHPDTGRPYEWPEESLADLDIGGSAGDRRGGGARVPRRGAGARAGPPEAGARSLAGADRRRRSVARAGRARWRRSGRRWRGSRTPTSTTTAGCASASRSRARWATPAAISSPPGRRSPARTMRRSPRRPGAGSRPSASAPARSTISPWSAAGSPIRRWCWTAPRRRRRASGGRAAGEGAGGGAEPAAPPPQPPFDLRRARRHPRARWSTTWSRPPAGRSRCCRSAPASARSAR